MLHNLLARRLTRLCCSKSLEGRLTALVLQALSCRKISLQLDCADFRSAEELTEAIEILRKAQYSVEVQSDSIGFRTVKVRLEYP